MNEMPDSEGQATDHPTVGHVVPFKVLATVWGTLLLLTLITVAVAGVDLGRFNLEIALAIATIKASLVLLYFMHMRYDRPMNAIVFIAALMFVMLFVSIALIDTQAYAPDLIPGYGPGLPR
ncbi:MAG TPA: cytochrome C oxidase subunit IV family protein [Thermoanaerobaculaceae bacterium]|nr:cytochrome C oxidase subunit IV family protein [Thermoanaerobaculaceae bacterium]